MTTLGPTNEELATVLEEMAALLVKQREPNPYRVQAYLQAAAMIRDHDEPLTLLYGAEGREGLTDLPGVGDAERIAAAKVIGKFLIETPNLGSFDKSSRRQHLLNGCIDFILNREVLTAQIDHLYIVNVDSVVHRSSGSG